METHIRTDFRQYGRESSGWDDLREYHPETYTQWKFDV